MALLAIQGGTLLGVARYSADPDRERAAYAIAVRTGWQHRGVGYLLLTRLIEVARDAGIRELFGDVLRENTTMLEMCRALGFIIVADHQDPAIVRAGKRLHPSEAP